MGSGSAKRVQSARASIMSIQADGGAGSGVRRRQAERSDATRRRILTAARAFFAERGYDATSVELILRSTGLSKGAFYHHFPDKRELLAAVYEDLERELVVALAEAGRT